MRRHESLGYNKKRYTFYFIIFLYSIIISLLLETTREEEREKKKSIKYIYFFLNKNNNIYIYTNSWWLTLECFIIQRCFTHWSIHIYLGSVRNVWNYSGSPRNFLILRLDGLNFLDHFFCRKKWKCSIKLFSPCR